VDSLLLVEHRCELRRDHDGVAAAGKRASEDAFAVSRAVVVRCVEEVHAEIERVMDRADRVVVDLAQPIGDRSPFELRTNGPPIAQQPRPIGKTSMPLRPSVRTPATTRPRILR
jgi:hypothetical protein